LKQIFSLLISFSFFLPAHAAVESRNRIEELFIWKISDEMKLSVPDEKSLTDLIRNLNKKRADANDKLQNTLKALSEAKESKEKERLLKEHRKALKAYNDLSLEEADQIQKIFDVNRAAQYFVLKGELTNKLKTLLASPEKSSQAPLPPPQVIEEK
jgi:Skp family chaperone for outer membrane proteins